MYIRAERWAVEGIGIENTQIEDATSWPEYCGLCNSVVCPLLVTESLGSVRL